MAPLASAQVAVTAEFRADEAPPHRLGDMCGLTFQPERITGLDVDGLPPTVQLLVAARTDLVAPGHLARLRERGEMDAAAVFDQPVGVKHQAGSLLRQLQLGSLEGLPAQSQSQGAVVDGGAQSAHGGRRVQPMADHVTDHQGDPGPGKGDDVEPVPAHPCLRGPVPVGNLQGGLFGQVITVTANWRFRNRRSTAASLVVGRPPAA
jgi:hypothetical protein